MSKILEFLGLVSKREPTEPAGRPQKPVAPTKKSITEEAVIGKLKKGNKQALSMPEDELKEWARSLCLKQELIDWYLNPEFAQTEKLFNSLNKAGGASSSAAATSISNEDEAFNDIDFNIKNISEEAQKPFMKVGQKIKIKLVVAEICKSDAQKAIRKMLSPILTKIDFQQQFGMFHSALVVGPWYLEWNNSSLCIPRKCYSSAAMLACDLEFGGKLGGVGFDLQTTIDKISDVIIEWNMSKQYDQQKANCQQFVDELCKALDIDLTSFKGPLGDYLDRLREKGECDLSFPISDEIRQAVGIREKKKYFETHEDLDKFVKELTEKEPEFEEKYPLDWGLLKSFDRAFWLRHYKSPEDKKYTPAGHPEESSCPFGDPQVTASFKKEWF